MDKTLLFFIFKALSILAGMLCIFFGYKLFKSGLFSPAGNVQIEGGNKQITAKLTFANTAPGTFFCVLGAIIVITALFKGFELKSDPQGGGKPNLILTGYVNGPKDQMYPQQQQQQLQQYMPKEYSSDGKIINRNFNYDTFPVYAFDPSLATNFRNQSFADSYIYSDKQNDSDIWSFLFKLITILVSAVALIISIRSLNLTAKYSATNIANATKNMRLSIQQAMAKTASEKAKDCNNLWKASRDAELGSPAIRPFPHYSIITEMVISREVIDKAFSLYAKNYDEAKYDGDDCAYLFWKQLTPDIRGFFRETAFRFGISGKNQVYSKQVYELYLFVKNHMEDPVPEDLVNELAKIVVP